MAMPAARTWIATTANETRTEEVKRLRMVDVMLVPPTLPFVGATLVVARNQSRSYTVHHVRRQEGDHKGRPYILTSRSNLYL